MLEHGPSAVDVTIICAVAGAIWTLYQHMRAMTKERRGEAEVLHKKITDLEMEIRTNYMTVDRFEELERRLYEGMTGVSQRLDDILKSLIAHSRNNE